MGDYNPRQITQMRWKDAKALEHLIFKVNDIDFNEASSVKLSESLEAKQLVKRIEYCYNNQVPLIIYEYANDRIFVSTNFGSDTEAYLSSFNGTDVNTRLNLVYDGQDTLSISLEEKTFLTATEAPKMYRHNLKISHNRTGYDDQKHDIFLTYYSSNNLVADTPEKLTTLTKATNGTNLRSPVYSITSTGSSDYDKISLYYIGAVYNGSAWNLMNSNGTSSGIAINSVTDTVEEA